MEVGLPLAVIGVVALVVLSSGGRPKAPGGLTYDARAKPLLKSLRAARQTQLDQEHGCHGCVKVATDAGGCSGALADWTCDVQAPTGARRTLQLETFRVRWNQNGCWYATEDCTSPVNSIRRVCPPAKVEQLRGCIHAPA